MHRRDFIISGTAAGVLAVTGPVSAQSVLGRLSEGDARTGTREILLLAARFATERLGRHDGFFADPQVHIPLPRQVERVQGQLQRIGMSGPVDDLELRLNRAAEAAMPQAQDILFDAVRSISLNDAIGIIRGPETAATDYLRSRSGRRLTQLLRPPMEDALESSGAYRLVASIEPHVGSGGGWLGRLMGGSSVSGSLRDQVTDHAVERALDGVFYYVGAEERAIRRDPVRRTSSLLRRLFD
jgi:hypothetical protein